MKLTPQQLRKIIAEEVAGLKEMESAEPLPAAPVADPDRARLVLFNAKKKQMLGRVAGFLDEAVGVLEDLGSMEVEMTGREAGDVASATADLYALRDFVASIVAAAAAVGRSPR